MSDYELEGGLQDLPEDVWKVNLMDITCSFTSEQFRRVAVREAVDGAVRQTLPSARSPRAAQPESHHLCCFTCTLVFVCASNSSHNANSE